MPNAIQDEILLGRAPVPSDLPDLLALLSHPRVSKTLGGPRSDRAVRQAITRWRHFWAERSFEYVGLPHLFYRLRRSRGGA